MPDIPRLTDAELDALRCVPGGSAVTDTPLTATELEKVRAWKPLTAAAAMHASAGFAGKEAQGGS